MKNLKNKIKAEALVNIKNWTPEMLRDWTKEKFIRSQDYMFLLAENYQDMANNNKNNGVDSPAMYEMYMQKKSKVLTAAGCLELVIDALF